jgi:hypothetical protein
MGFDSGGGGGGGAPTDAPYLTSSSDPDLSNETVVTNPENTPAWEEDANSPVTASSANQAQISLSSAYDIILVQAFLDDQASSSNNADVTVDTVSSGYDYVVAGGTETSGASAWQNVVPMGPGRQAHASFILSGRFSGPTGIRTFLSAGKSGVLLTGLNTNPTSPLDSIVIDRGAATDYRIRAYGVEV